MDAVAREFVPALGGSDYGEVYLEESSSLAIRLEESKIDDIACSAERGMSLRHLRRRGPGVETLFGSLHSLEPAEALRLSRELLAGARDGPVPAAELSHRHLARRDPAAVGLDEKIALVRAADAAARGRSESVRQVTVTYAERRRAFGVINSEEASRREERSTVLFAVSVVAEKGGILQTGSAVIGGLKGFELLSDYSPTAAARAAAARALAKLDAPKARAGEMPVVLSSSAGGTFVHEAIGHSLEADHVQEGSSPAYKGKIGSVIADARISIIDDPTLPFARGSYRFDDEGLSSQPTVLVDHGVLKDYLYDRVTAMKDGRASNGHGRRESFHSRPIPRMTNLYIGPGPDDPAEIVRGLKAGLLVTRMGGGQVNTATGEFVFEIEEGFWVSDGKVRHPVRDANLLGVGPEVLRSIDRVGWDIGWGIGSCGKDGQYVPVSDGQPTLHIPKLLVGGRHEAA